MGKEEAVEDGENLKSDRAVIFSARISLQLWKAEEKKYVHLYFQMFLIEQAPLPASAGGISLPTWSTSFGKYKSALLLCPPFSQCQNAETCLHQGDDFLSEEHKVGSWMECDVLQLVKVL